MRKRTSTWWHFLTLICCYLIQLIIGGKMNGALRDSSTSFSWGLTLFEKTPISLKKNPRQAGFSYAATKGGDTAQLFHLVSIWFRNVDIATQKNKCDLILEYVFKGNASLRTVIWTTPFLPFFQCTKSRNRPTSGITVPQFTMPRHPPSPTDPFLSALKRKRQQRLFFIDGYDCIRVLQSINPLT